MTQLYRKKYEYRISILSFLKNKCKDYFSIIQRILPEKNPDICILCQGGNAIVSSN
jgi:hypothetical protein